MLETMEKCTFIRLSYLFNDIVACLFLVYMYICVWHQLSSNLKSDMCFVWGPQFSELSFLFPDLTHLYAGFLNTFLYNCLNYFPFLYEIGNFASLI